MKTIKLTPTQKRELLAGIVTYRVNNNEDIIPFVGRNLGDFNYVELFEEYFEKVGVINRELGDIYLNWKYPVADQISKPAVCQNRVRGYDNPHPKRYSKLTEMETIVFDFLLEELEPWIGGENYSCVDVEDIAKGTKIPESQLRGVLSSLAKKGILESYDHNITEDFRTPAKWITLWLFRDQVEHSQESLIKLVK